jgi:homoserine kinase type II
VLRDWLAAPVEPAARPGLAPGLNLLLRRAAALVTKHAPAAVRGLEPWASVPLRVQPCVRDLRGEHVLFAGDRVTGIVDYGAMAEDHPAIDLARLLGDFAGENEPLFAAGLRAYRDAGGFLDTPDGFVGTLERAGALGSAIMWLVRLRLNRAAHHETGAAEARLTRLIHRVEQFGSA